MLYSVEKLEEERGLLLCDGCGRLAPYYKRDKKNEVEGVEPVFEWQGNAFCLECFVDIIKVNPNVIYPAKLIPLEKLGKTDWKDKI